MFRKHLFSLILLGTLAASTLAAEIVVRIAPPRAVVEHRGRAPGRDHIWINGYHNWNGGRYVWVPGRWDRRPHGRARWQQHRWQRRGGTYVFIEGRWR